MVSQKTFIKIAKFKPEWTPIQNEGVIYLGNKAKSKARVLFKESGISTLVAFGKVKQFMEKIR